MQRNQIREILKKKSGSKLDSFLIKKRRKKESEHDLINMLQTWSHHLLYSKNVYPKQAFHQRQVLGIPVYVALSPPLREYLDGFFAKIKPHIDSINHIQIVLYGAKNQVLEVNTVYIQNLQQKEVQLQEEESEGQPLNLLQKEIQFKQFLNGLKQQLQLGYRRGETEDVRFKFRVSYLLQGSTKESRSMLDGWVSQPKLPQGDSHIVGHLISPNLNLIFEMGR